MVTTTAQAVPAAIVNKQLADRGRNTHATAADMANELFEGSSMVLTALSVVGALVLLGAFLATIAGIWQMLRGERGGLELLSSGIFGVIVLIAGMSVVM